MLLTLLADTSPFAGVDWGSLGLQVTALLAPVAMAVLTWLFRALALLTVAKTKAGAAQDILLRVEGLAYKVVAELEQTTSTALRDAAADGKIDSEEAAKIKQTALDTLHSYLGPKGFEELMAALGVGPQTASQFLSTAIEAALHGLKGAALGKLLPGVVSQFEPAAPAPAQ